MPIQFACPHYQTQVSVGDQFAGVTGPCRECGQTITIPGDFATPFSDANNVYADASVVPPRKSSTGSFVTMGLGDKGKKWPVNDALVFRLVP